MSVDLSKTGLSREPDTQACLAEDLHAPHLWGEHDRFLCHGGHALIPTTREKGAVRSYDLTPAFARPTTSPLNEKVKSVIPVKTKTTTVTTIKPKTYYVPVRTDDSLPLGVEEARAFAHEMHKDQKDKNGDPYYHHLDAVQNGVVVLGGDAEEQIAALFHDAIEDNQTTWEILKGIGVTKRSASIIEAVTKRTSEEQSLYLARIVKEGHGACRVKLADMLHNRRPDRVARLNTYTDDRQKQKYLPGIAALMMELGYISTEADLATKPQGSGYSYTTTTSTGTKTTVVGGNNNKSKTKQYALGSLINGDWPVSWTAPITHHTSPKKGEKKAIFELADGRIMEMDTSNHKGEPIKVWAYERYTWANDDTVLSWVGNDAKQAFRALTEPPKPVSSLAEDVLAEWDAEAMAGWGE